MSATESYNASIEAGVAVSADLLQMLELEGQNESVNEFFGRAQE